MSGRVLLADGDVERARSLAEACRARGFECAIRHQGAATLETALAELPDVLVCQLELPLIDGPQLAAILRANPHTREIGLVFLGDDPADAERRGLPGPVIPPPADPAWVAGCVHDALGTRRPASADAEEGVEGQLAQLPLADLLQLSHVSRRTGSVEVVRGLGRSRRQVGRIVLRAGDVVHAEVGGVQGKKALFRLLSWDRGAFAFRPEPADVEPTIQTPTRALLREGQRQAREWRQLAVELPPLSATVSLRIPRSSLPNVIHPLTQEVLVVLDLCSRVGDVVEQCTYPDYQVLRTLHTLIQRGMVELQREPEAPTPAREQRLFTPARTARLREWLEADRPGGPPTRDAKLLVVASDPAAAQDLGRLLARLPEVTLDPRVERGGLAADDLVPFARIRVDAEIGIDVLHVPAAKRFQPLWPVAAHGALGTLLVLSGEAERAGPALHAAAAALRTQTSRRLVALRLGDKGEPPLADELRGPLGLVGEESLVSIPAEDPQEAERRLGELLGRILP